MPRSMIVTIVMLLVLAGTRLAWAQTAPSVTGTVQQYLLNHHGEVHGLLLSDGTIVRFPPHLGVALATSIHIGDQVTVIGFMGPNTSQGRAIKALSINNVKTDRTLVDQPPTTSPLPPHLRGMTTTTLTVSGTVSRFLVNPQGEIDGLILSGGEQVTFKPHQGTLIALAVGRNESPITVTGFGTDNAFGTVLESESLTVEGKMVWTR